MISSLGLVISDLIHNFTEYDRQHGAVESGVIVVVVEPEFDKNKCQER
jgi:predicted methyltransferase